MRRAIVIVMDGCGVGAAPDAPEFNDHDNPSTLLHVWNAVGGFNAPNLRRIGMLEAAGIEGQSAPQEARFGRLMPLSKGGKDSVTGHWEMMGIVVDAPFPTYPEGFPDQLVHEFERRIGTSVLGNRPASGTKIIAELGPEHLRTGHPILYTSADSVFQVAAHEEVVPIERLYEICRIGREVCTGENSVQRVIARPFIGTAEVGFTRTERRKDFPLAPAPNLVDEIGDVVGIGVVPELFDGRGFRPMRRTQSNVEHEVALREAMAAKDARFIFANFEDFDMLYGHRNDAPGFAKCLETFDRTLGEVIANLQSEDLLIVTADHGNDPTDASTDHSREYIPACLVGHQAAGAVGDVTGFTAIGATVADHLGVPWSVGSSLL